MLRATPLFTATAALSRAIGIGANTTIFSVTNALLLRPLSEPYRLVDVGCTRGWGFDSVWYPNYRDLASAWRSSPGVYAYTMEPHAMGLAARETRNVSTVPRCR